MKMPEHQKMLLASRLVKDCQKEISGGCCLDEIYMACFKANADGTS